MEAGEETATTRTRDSIRRAMHGACPPPRGASASRTARLRPPPVPSAAARPPRRRRRKRRRRPSRRPKPKRTKNRQRAKTTRSRREKKHREDRCMLRSALTGSERHGRRLGRVRLHRALRTDKVCRCDFVATSIRFVVCGADSPHRRQRTSRPDSVQKGRMQSLAEGGRSRQLSADCARQALPAAVSRGIT